MAISSPEMMLVPKIDNQYEQLLQRNGTYQGKYHQSFHCRFYGQYDTCFLREDPAMIFISQRVYLIVMCKAIE